MFASDLSQCSQASSGRYLVYAMCLIGLFGGYLLTRLLIRSLRNLKSSKKERAQLWRMAKANPGKSIWFIIRLIVVGWRGILITVFSMLAILGCILVGPILLISGAGGC